MPKISIDGLRCKGCLLCIKYCPRDCLKPSDTYDSHGIKIVEVVKASECILCKNCELICPESCIKVSKDE